MRYYPHRRDVVVPWNNPNGGPDSRRSKEKKMRFVRILMLIAGLAAVSAFAQGPPPPFSPSQLDEIVARIALYPDPLVAQILAGASYTDQIPAAAKWSDQHHYLYGKALADAIQEDQLPWDPSV